MPPDLEFLQPGSAGWKAFEGELVAAGLPIDDLGEPYQRFFRHRDACAYGGYQLIGAVALIRSIVVGATARKCGIGSEILGHILALASDAGATEAWLLTTDAAAFFERQGFTIADRAKVPAAISASRQFVSLCPASAVVMQRRISSQKDLP